MTSTYLLYRLYSQDLQRTQERIADSNLVKRDADYYDANIGKISNVDDFLKDSRLYNYALKAYGLEEMANSRAYIRKVLTSDLSDPESFANKLTDNRFSRLASAFNFQPDGSVGNSGTAAQTDVQGAELVSMYRAKQASVRSTAAINAEVAYYQENIGKVKSAEDFVNNGRLFRLALQAYGLNPGSESRSTILKVLTSDTSDPRSFVNSRAKAAYLEMASDFNFSTDGTIGAKRQAQSDQDATALRTAYLSKFTEGTPEYATAEFDMSYYLGRIGSIDNVDEFVNNDRMTKVVRTAYGLPDTVSNTTLRQIMTSDVGNERSFANISSNPTFRRIAEDFNFNTNGSLGRVSVVQSDGKVTELLQLYTINTPAKEREAAKTEIRYYNDTILSIDSVDEMLADKRLMEVVKRAVGLEGVEVSNKKLRDVLTSDLSDFGSYAYTLADSRYVKLAGMFSFGPNGTAADAGSGVQSKQDMLATRLNYINQSIEQEAGAQNEAVRLALYFKRMASSLSDPYVILGDRALLEVVSTALNIPVEARNASIEQQARMITDKLDLKELRDPEKLERFLTRFAVLYDMKQGGINQNTPGAIALQLLTGG